jgi:hypothetical protein
MSQSLDKNPYTSQKYEVTVDAWIIVQKSVLRGQKARVRIIILPTKILTVLSQSKWRGKSRDLVDLLVARRLSSNYLLAFQLYLLF